ncbi:MAG: OadG family protein [Firmicutes bacterium]|nr:OadG family protein [Bacillota bacterium]
MDILWYGLKVSIVGMAVVFIGLIILIGCVTVLKGLGGKGEGTKEKPSSVPARGVPPVAPPYREYTPGPTLTLGDNALYAAITGAVAETLASEGVNPEGGFVITSVKAR